jgi:hypothetical protein
LSRYAKAEEDCNDAISLDKNYVKAYARRGSARIGLKRYYEAIDGKTGGVVNSSLM